MDRGRPRGSVDWAEPVRIPLPESEDRGVGLGPHQPPRSTVGSRGGSEKLPQLNQVHEFSFSRRHLRRDDGVRPGQRWQLFLALGAG